MKSVFKWSALALSAYLLLLIIKLPAQQVINRLSLPPNVSLHGISGTIWQGQAIAANINGLPIQKISWSMDFLPLLLGNISADIKAGNIREQDAIAINGKLVVSGSRLQLNNVQAYLPTNLMISLLPLPFPVKAEGRFKIDIDELDYAKSCQILKGKGQWLNAQVAGLNQMIQLGDFTANMDCIDNNVVLDVKEPNSFGLSAKAVIPSNLKFSVQGRFKPDAKLPEEVHQAAQFFGKKDNQGYYFLKF